jgi:hypothetical protein
LGDFGVFTRWKSFSDGEYFLSKRKFVANEEKDLVNGNRRVAATNAALANGQDI